MSNLFFVRNRNYQPFYKKELLLTLPTRVGIDRARPQCAAGDSRLAHLRGYISVGGPPFFSRQFTYSTPGD